ncbi:hypothetical protein ACHAW6_007372 [Cyclotella cf. meneghiniana]
MIACNFFSVEGKEQIRRIDPEIESVWIDPEELYRGDCEAWNEDDLKSLGSLGHCIGKNESINKIVIFGEYLQLFDPQNELNIDCQYTGVPAADWEAFFDGVSQSRSVKWIDLNDICLGGHVLKLFETPNLERAEFELCTITSQTASAIRRVPSLRCVAFTDQSDNWDVTDAAAFISSLNHNYNLKCLILHELSINEGEARALGDIFSDPKSTIRKLELVHCSTEVPPLLLWDGLVNSSSLRELVFHENLDMGLCQRVSNVLSSPAASLKVLDLSEEVIDDERAGALARGLAQNSTLRELNLSSLGLITAAGWLSIFSSLRNPNLRLKRIILGYNREINDQAVSSFGEVLIASKNTINEFSLNGCMEIKTAGWTAFTTAFLTPMPKLRELHMGNTNFDDDALVKLASGLHNKPCLKKMNLGYASITTTGWEAISKVLCNTSSFDAIRGSNHTLHEIKINQCIGWGSNDVSLPPIIEKLLEMNRRGAASEVARLKIIEYYNEINIGALVYDQPEMQLKLVPSVMSWLWKDGSKHNTLYHFVRNQSYLLEGARRNASAG